MIKIYEKFKNTGNNSDKSHGVIGVVFELTPREI